jgi:autotransporter-associated beta strand protein
MRWVVAMGICATTVAAQADTGVWTNVSGGYWADAANWQDGYVPVGAPNAADFSALGSGGTVTITNYTGMGAILFSNATDAVWTLLGTMGFAHSPLHPSENLGEILVGGGTLNFAASIASADYGVAKTGPGMLRFSTTHTYTGNTRLDGGTLALTNGAVLQRSSVIFNATNAVLTLEGDASIGGVESLVSPEPGIALNGRTLRIGGAGTTMWGGRLTGDGALTAVRGGVQTLTARQSYAGVTRLENGSLRLGKTVGRTVAWWRFDDASDIGKDSGTLGNNLVKTGAPTQWYTNDAVRGGVLSLDNGAYLAGQGTGKDIFGLPTNNAPFTVAFWIKPAVDVPATAVVYGWGSYDAYGRCNGMRLNTPTSSTPLLYTNWSNNRNIPFSGNLADGNWHHVAIIYTGSQFRFYIDGTQCLADNQTTALSVVAGNFTIGRGWATSYFKGLIDDFVIADWAMAGAELSVVRTSGQAPDTSAYAVDNLLPATANLEVGYDGFLYLRDQTVATLGGEGAAGGIALQNGGTLTVNGTGSATSTVFRSALTGDGRFVKRGADYTLNLTGGNSYTGATEVQEGTLALAPKGIPGLQAYYRFDDPACLGRDSSGNGYDLTAGNTPAYTANGRYGGAASFNTADQDLLRTGRFPETLPTGNGSYTFAVWCNPSSGNVKGMPLCWGNASGAYSAATLFRFDSTTTVLFSNFGNNQTVDAGIDLFTDALSNGWHHIAGTFDGSNGIRRVYVDGALKWTDSTSYTLAITNSLLQLGGAPYSTANYYDGLLDEVMIFNRALNASEIQAAMSGRRTVRDALAGMTPAQPVACYHFDDAANPGKDGGPYGYDLAASTSTVAVTSSGKFGGALDLTSSYGYLVWTNSVFPEMMPTGNQAVTISAWINPKTDADSSGAFVFWGAMGWSECHVLRLSGTANRGIRYTNAQVGLDSEGIDRLDFGGAPEGWHHIASVYDPNAAGTCRRLYIDGVLMVQDGYKNLDVRTNQFYIGRMESPADKWFQGLIDEMAIYNRALSPAEIRSVMRRETAVLPTNTTLSVASGAKVDLNGAEQRVAALAGAGEIGLGAGVLTVAGGTCRFDGCLSGQGDLAVRDGAVLTLAGTNSFAGSATVSNATLLVSGVTTGGVETVIRSGGILGGSGKIKGSVTFSDSAVLVAGTTPLTVDGTVTLGAVGTVTVSLPSGFTGGRFTLISATTVSAPFGLSGWTVSGVDASWKSVLRQDGGTLTLSVFRRGTLISVQ